MTFEEARLIAIEAKRVADEFNRWMGVEPSPDFDKLPKPEQAKLVQGIVTIVKAMKTLGYEVKEPQ